MRHADEVSTDEGPAAAMGALGITTYMRASHSTGSFESVMSASAAVIPCM